MSDVKVALAEHETSEVHAFGTCSNGSVWGQLYFNLEL